MHKQQWDVHLHECFRFLFIPPPVMRPRIRRNGDRTVDFVSVLLHEIAGLMQNQKLNDLELDKYRLSQSRIVKIVEKMEALYSSQASLTARLGRTRAL